MTARMQLHVITAAETTIVDDVTLVRLEADDGSRGIQPGHEPTVVVLAAAAVEVRIAGHETTEFFAVEEGMAIIRRDAVRLVTPWAARADDLETLAAQVRRRGRFRDEVEARARVLAHRHELATQRALSALRREVHA